MNQLPEALHPFASYRQFILWAPVPNGARTDKKPVNSATGLVHDAHDPSIWLDADTAIQRASLMGYGVGFVFTATDPFFFLDIDKCLQPDGQWSPLAQQLCATFQGAAVEVSQSGTGLHIFGTGAVPDHACKNIPLGLELYTDKRFVALTGTGATGSAAIDATAALSATVLHYFPPSAPVADAEWTDGPCPEWGGPADDEELISRMMSSKSAGAIFSGRASVSALWNCDEDALALAYPDERGFDRSSADAALCQHLAFWTGKDCERIDRLFRRSGLYRDKWEDRPDYRSRTILHAVGYCNDVYGKQRAEAVEAPESVQPTAAMVATEGLRTGFQFLAVSQQLELFKDCTYVRDAHRVFTPDGALLKSEQFRASYGGYTFAMDNNNDKVTKNAWEAFTESQGYNFPKAHGVCFRPECAPGTLIPEENQLLVNTYVPAGVERKEGDPALFLNHVGKLLPNASDRAIVLAYMAACVQYPGVKFQWAPLLQGVEGNGKSLLMTAVAKAVGIKYTHKPPASDISNVFNAWIVRKLFIAVEEVYVADRQEVIDALKPLITDDRVPVTPKGVDQQTGDNRANFMMASNHRDAYRKTANDRRVSMFFTAQQNAGDLIRDGMDGMYFPNLYKWLKEDGYAIVAKYLSEYQIPDELNPATHLMRAPDTSSTGEAIEASLGGVEQEVLEAISEGRAGFAGGWVSSMAFDRMLELRRDDKRIPRNRRKDLLESLGYVLHPGLNDGRVNSVVPFENGKPRLYIKEGHPAANFVTPAEILKQYLLAQGYEQGTAGAAGTVFGAPH